LNAQAFYYSADDTLLQPTWKIPMTDRKVALITGSGTGVGAATALLLARQGYNMVINYSRSEAEAKASQAACDAAGADTLLVQGDVADDAACRALVQAAIERWGRVDALINNAGTLLMHTRPCCATRFRTWWKRLASNWGRAFA
jgi:NAD(P)-dependent dehydrogenase (short-subunit alcohol dehydrogenase family)